MFYVETLSQEQIAKLNLYADSFIQYVERTFLEDRTLKVVRIGLRLLRKLKSQALAIKPFGCVETFIILTLSLCRFHTTLLRQPGF